jgi:shikimate dehydrogenase
MPDRKFGLIGQNLSHSFSKKYFDEKFIKEKIVDTSYSLFEIDAVNKMPDLFLEDPFLAGLNVTIPFKESVIDYIDELKEPASEIGSVNVIKKTENKLIGYNTDYFGFKESLNRWIFSPVQTAFILGTGGAAKTVKFVLDELGIPTTFVSRSRGDDKISYEELHAELEKDLPTLIVNTTPLGTFPDIESVPDIPFHKISQQHWVYDLVYNPPETRLMRQSKEIGAKIKNGYEMLVLQAERSWEIWNSQD